MLNLKKKLFKQQTNEVNMLLGEMLRNIEPEKYEEWVEKLEIRPELKEELSNVVEQELNRRKNEEFTTNA